MNTKKLLVLSGLLIVLVLIAVLRNQLQKKAESSSGGPFFTGLTENTISAFSIADDKGTVTVRRKGDIWVIGAETDGTGGMPVGTDTSGTVTTRTYTADSASVQTVLEKLTAMHKDVLISSNPEKQELFEVDTAKGILVTVWDSHDKEIGAFRIGKSGPDWSSHYVREVGSDKVYSVGGSIRYSFFTDKNRWRDKGIVSFDPEKAQKLSLVKKDGYTISLSKSIDTSGNTAWSVTAPETFTAKTDVVEKIVSSLSSLKTAEWEENTALSDDTLGFVNPELTVTVTLANGDTKSVTFGNEKNNTGKFWTRSSGKDDLFLVNNSAMTDIDTNIDDLRPDEMPEQAVTMPAPGS